MALLDSSDDIVTDPRDMGDLLTKRSGDVLSNKTICNDTLSKWLQESDVQLPDTDDHGWALQQQHMQKAIKYAHETSGGPDGIPYSAYKRFDGSAQILCEAAQALLTPGGPRPPPIFNIAFLCCLPKKPVSSHPLHGSV